MSASRSKYESEALRAFNEAYSRHEYKSLSQKIAQLENERVNEADRDSRAAALFALAKELGERRSALWNFHGWAERLYKMAYDVSNEKQLKAEIALGRADLSPIMPPAERYRLYQEALEGGDEGTQQAARKSLEKLDAKNTALQQSLEKDRRLPFFVDSKRFAMVIPRMLAEAKTASDKHAIPHSAAKEAKTDVRESLLQKAVDGLFCYPPRTVAATAIFAELDKDSEAKLYKGSEVARVLHLASQHLIKPQENLKNLKNIMLILLKMDANHPHAKALIKILNNKSGFDMGFGSSQELRHAMADLIIRQGLAKDVTNANHNSVLKEWLRTPVNWILQNADSTPRDDTGSYSRIMLAASAAPVPPSRPPSP